MKIALHHRDAKIRGCCAEMLCATTSAVLKIISHNTPLDLALGIICIPLFVAVQTLVAQEQRPPPQDASVVNLNPGAIHNLPLDLARRAEIERAVKNRDYTPAETLLMKEIEANPGRPELLTFVGGIFFLDGKYLNAAIALKKAEVLAPLDDRSRFTLAMSYILLNRRDWAHPELEKLVRSNPQSALYLYWLARLDYDASRYAAAVDKLRQVIKLDAAFVKAYDNLGLSYEALGEHDAAIQSYGEAIRLNRLRPPHSPWPSLNLGVMLVRSGKLAEAKTHLRESLRYDPKFAQAHYQLGALLEKQNNYAEAIRHLAEATTHDPAYPEPHYVLGRIYRRQGDRENAMKALDTFQRLKQRRGKQ